MKLLQKYYNEIILEEKKMNIFKKLTLQTVFMTLLVIAMYAILQLPMFPESISVYIDSIVTGTGILAIAPVITGDKGSSFFGSNNLTLGPANVYYGNFNLPNLAGTISITINTDTVTGVGTAFNTVLKVGDYVLFNSSTIPVQIKEITSATSMKTMTLAPSTLAAVTFKKVECVNLGGNDGVTLKFGVKKTELKEAQAGDNAADKAITGYMCDIEFGLTRTTLERIEKLLQGFQTQRNIGGDYVGGGFGYPSGETDLDIASQLRIVRIKKGIESIDPMDLVTILKCAPNVEAESKYDATSQRVMKTMFTGYIDPTVTINGVAQIFTFGTVTNT
jgi:hypothetical protein